MVFKQPLIFDLICDQSKIHHKGWVGVPDLVIEVLSPSTALKDKRVKLRHYRLSGVRESTTPFLRVWLTVPRQTVATIIA
ncbi:Uma2 family endonuclease [Desulfosporosinus sp. BG]|uniref:Uma2 family endonuclease n=1 Tax=Desulfosporosinus sp. BG TaxID=1633135 RepID=UPI00249DA37C|nr:Uma2 family endonuclease [Desulfosporosinus sp. BG]